MPLFKQGVDRRTGMSGLRHYKMLKYLEIQEAFAEYELNGYMMSSLGFAVDSTRLALSNIEGLIFSLEDTPGGVEQSLPFRDYQNFTHQLFVSEFRQIRREIINYGLYQYSVKWGFEYANLNATNKEQIDAILIDFYPVKITKPPAIPDI